MPVKKIILHDVNISHQRLVELTKLADQAKPYYDYIERKAKEIACDHRTLTEILMSANKELLKSIFVACYQEDSSLCPLLFDGIGNPYPQNVACFFFLAWMIRDAPTQRLQPLLSRMIKNAGKNNLSRTDAEIESLVELFFEYRGNVKSFSWDAIREIVIDRLEGSRRSHSGHMQEVVLRSAVATAIQNFFATHFNYGSFDKVVLESKQIKLGIQTVDIAVTLKKQGFPDKHIYFPVKTRETQGGGHAHLFSRDLIVAISDIKKHEPDCFISPFIVAENWNVKDFDEISEMIQKIFYFNTNPNEFESLADSEQIEINRFIAGILSNE